MAGPSWLADTFAAVMIATALYCVSRLAASRLQSRPAEHDVDAVHVVMGVAMAGMLVPRLNFFWAGGWEIIFGGAAAWFGWQVLRAYRSPDSEGHGPAHHLPHLLACGAMLYMFLVVVPASVALITAGTPMGGPAGTGAHFPTLALLLALALLGYVIWTTDKITALAPVGPAAARVQVPAMAESAAGLSSAGHAGLVTPGDPAGTEDASPRPAGPVPLSPRLAACCEIAMGVTMGYMLILLL